MMSSVSAYELNEDIEKNKRAHGEQVKFFSATDGSGVDQVNGHLRARELSLQLPDEQHVRVHKRLSLVQKLTLWVMLLITVCTLCWDVFSILSAINLLVHARAKLTQIAAELTAARLIELHAAAPVN